MPTFDLIYPHEVSDCVKYIAEHGGGKRVSITKISSKRSVEQNRTQRMWHNEAAEFLRDETAEEKRAYCKLHFGVPILRNEDDNFCAEYDRLIRPMAYEDKLSLMALPIDFPVTRLMSTDQKCRYLNQVEVHYRGLGVPLTEPKKR